jgi:branched-chain amino acid transport system substrate-binding protein
MSISGEAEARATSRSFRGHVRLAAGLVAAMFVLAGCGHSSSTSSKTGGANNVIRIGLEAPLSGSQKSVGIGMLNAARLAADDLNAHGGVLGEKVVIVPIDDKADPATGVIAANRAIAAGLTGVVGPYNSGVGVKTLPLYIKAGLVPIRLTSADSTQGFGVTLQPMTSQIAPVATTAITKWEKATSVAIIYDKTPGYTADANTAMKADLMKAGVTIMSDTAITPGKSNYSSAVSAATATNPQLVYVIAYYPEAGLIAKEMHEASSSAKCLADFGAYDSGFIKVAGIPAAEACPVVGVPAPNDFAGSARLVALYWAKYRSAPGTWSPYAYDSVEILAAAARSAGTFDSAKLKAALDAMSGWSGWTGKVRFDASTGNRTPPSVTVVVSNSSGAFHTSADWERATGFSF